MPLKSRNRTIQLNSHSGYPQQFLIKLIYLSHAIERHSLFTDAESLYFYVCVTAHCVIFSCALFALRRFSEYSSFDTEYGQKLMRFLTRSVVFLSTTELGKITMPLQQVNDLIENRLLAALPSEEYARILPHLEPLSFSLGEPIYESGKQLKHVCFPTTCIVSLLYTMENGTSAEIGVVGNEGVAGIALFMGGDTAPNRAIVQSAGAALKMNALALRNEFIRAGEFQRLLLRYTQALITQISQTAVCNRLHPIEKQLCRWLLLSHDRIQSDELKMTQELIANMLGVRREGVTYAAGHLQAEGLIKYARGRITILNRKGLEATVCECYQVVKGEYDRLLG